MTMDDERTPQILYGEAANLEEEPSSDILKLAISCACWKTDDDVEFDQASGDVYITEKQVLFRCSQKQDHSVAIDAECILLHAQSEDQVLYLQLQEDPSNETEVMELTLTLASSEDCQRLFEALSQLISRNPVDDDDDDDGMMMAGEEYGEDMIVAAEQNSEQQAPGEATEEERDAMLNRLDALLVIPPHLQADNGGQFDDADDEIL